jgi:ankyrin repeat protein
MYLKFLLITALLAKCSSMDQENLTGRDVRIFKDTPVWEAALAIRDNDVAKVKSLLQGKPKSILDYKEKYYGQTLLNWAVYRDSYNSSKILAELGADPNIKSNDSTSAMIHAADKIDANYLERY